MGTIRWGSSLCPRLSLSRIAESDHAMNGIVAAKICDTLATFLSVQCVVNELEAHVDRCYEVVSIWNVGEDAGAALGCSHFMVVHLTGERLSLRHVLLVSAINVNGGVRVAIAIIIVFLAPASLCGSPALC